MGKWLGAVLFFACSSFIPVQARMQVECVTYTVTYPLQDGTVVTEPGGYCWLEWHPDPNDFPYEPPTIPVPPGAPPIPNPNMCQSTLDNWPSGCSKLKRPFLQLNGCGPQGILGGLIPDNYGPVGWTGACNTHDRCYGTYGQTKSNCDVGLINDLKAACNRYYRGQIGLLEYKFGPDLPLDVQDEIGRLEGETLVCDTRADVYGDAVHSLGASAFAKGQQLGKCIQAHDDRDRYCGRSN